MHSFLKRRHLPHVVLKTAGLVHVIEATVHYSQHKVKFVVYLTGNIILNNLP